MTLLTLAKDFKDNLNVTLCTKSGRVIGKFSKEEIIYEKGFACALINYEVIAQLRPCSFVLDTTLNEVKKAVKEYNRVFFDFGEYFELPCKENNFKELVIYKDMKEYRK